MFNNHSIKIPDWTVELAGDLRENMIGSENKLSK
jgi:hypothetical protein